MGWRPGRIAAVLALALAAVGLGACQTAPATGEQIFTAGLSPEDEVRLGRQEHPKILAEFGGAYEDPELSAYISNLGDALAQTSELPDLDFTFTLLDTPVVNAFALPGGYVYVTRGLLALADDEAEVAGVLAHEIGHVTARHSAERYGSQVAASVFNQAVGLLIGGPVSQVTGGATAIALQSYSRDQEFQADTLGVRYLSRAGYDPQAMASFLAKLQAHSRLEAELRGRPGEADSFDIMQTHPRTGDRIQRAIREAGTKPVQAPVRGRDIYLSKIDGMLYGDNPDEGVVRGDRFLHPSLRLAFQVPQDFRLLNGKTRVIALGPQGARIIFELGPRPSAGTMTAYLVNEWRRPEALSEVQALDVNGMPAATGVARLRTRQGQIDVRLVAIRYAPDRVYRFIFVTPPGLTERLALDLRRTTYSFRKLSAAEAAAIRPLRIKIHRVRSGETVSGLAARTPFAELREKRFRTLNGLASGSTLAAGQEVKLIAD